MIDRAKKRVNQVGLWGRRSLPTKLGYLYADADPELFFARLLDWIPFTPIFNCSGNPALTLPLHWNKAGLPIGVHFGGRYADEATLLRLAAQLEKARPWKKRHPDTGCWNLD